MKTNVYMASYEDLSQLSVNADNLANAVKELAQIKSDEPMLLQRKITGIQIPDPPEPLPVAVVFCRAEREEEGETLPDTVTVRPDTAMERTPGSTVMLYAIDTAADPTVEFTGWYDEEGLRISTEPSFAFTVPEVATSGQTVLLTAKFKAKVAPSVFTVTVDTAMADGSVVPDSCVARPLSIQCEEGESVNLYAITTDADYVFVAWKDSEGTVLSTDTTYVYTPTANTVVTAVFEGV
jgi:uncharacterized repeat protein (TIGR02543 family)